MRHLLLIAAALLLTACATTSAAPVPPASLVNLDAPVDVSDSIVRVVESIETTTYLVDGDSAAEIRASLNRYGPYSQADGRTYDAVTRWGIGWSFRFRSDDGSCNLEAGTIELAVVITLPELRQESALTPALQQRWQEYHEALTVHEDEHVAGVRQGVRALQAAFDAAPAMATCRELGDYLSDLGAAYEEAMRAADVQFDRETGHGRNDGAVFP